MADKYEEKQDQQLLNKQEVKYKYKENDPNYKGEKVDQNLMNGVIENRSCTDFLFFIIFVALWVGIVWVAQYAFKNGDYKRIASPYDSQGNQCGIDLAVSGYKYLFYVDQSIIPGKINYTSFCVDKCPKTGQQSVNCFNDTRQLCNDTSKIQDTYTLVTICIPTSTELQKKILNYIGISDTTKYSNDLRKSWPVILGSGFIAFALSFILLTLLKYFIKPIMWIQMLLIFALLIVASSVSIQTYIKQNNGNPQYNGTKQYYLAGSIVFPILLLFYTILVCLIFKKIRLCVEIMGYASEFINEVCTVLVVPLILFVYIALFLSFWFAVTIYVYTIGDSQWRVGSSLPFGEMMWSEGVKRMLGLQIVSLIWNIEFIICFSYFVIASSAAQWYFTEEMNEVESSQKRAVHKSFWRAFRYHLGTLAFGSFILTFIWILKILIEIVHQNLKASSHNEQANACLNVFCKCCQCYLDCFERFIRFLNQGAYILCAIQGKSFCTSAHDAFYIMIRNPIRFAAMKWVGTVFIFIGQLTIVGSTVALCYLIFEYSPDYKGVLFSNVLPLVLIGVISYLISSIFVCIHGIAADTIIYCFCIDEEIHQHTGTGPKFSPNGLHEFFTKENL